MKTVVTINYRKFKYRGSAFKVPNLSRWLVVVSGPQMIDDIRQASDDQMSFGEAVAEVCSLGAVYEASHR
jgi:hypothetical protein